MRVWIRILDVKFDLEDYKWWQFRQRESHKHTSNIPALPTRLPSLGPLPSDGVGGSPLLHAMEQ